MAFTLNTLKITKPSSSGRGPSLLSYTHATDTVAQIRADAYFNDDSGATDDQKAFSALFDKMNKAVVIARSGATTGGGLVLCVLERKGGATTTTAKDIDTVQYEAGA